MTRIQMSEWWAKRGEAWAAVCDAERAMLAAEVCRTGDQDLDRIMRHALGCLAGAREMIAIATEIVEQKAKKLGGPKESL